MPTYDKELLNRLVSQIIMNGDYRLTSKNLMKGTVKIDESKLANEILTIGKEFIPLITQFENIGQLLNILRTKIRENQSQAREDILQDAVGQTIKGFSYKDFVPFVSITDGDKTIFYSISKREITDLDYKTYCLLFEKEYRTKPLAAVVEFNPYRPEAMFTEHSAKYGQECTHLNLYKRPEWQYEHRLSASEITKYSKLPHYIESFMSHLFPNENCREFVYDWLHYALTSRAETYLVMNGAKGIGKNILSDLICKKLLGKENHKIAPKAILQEKFNSALRNARMLVFDEFKVTEAEHINCLKRYANEDQMIENKGVDVGATEKTFNSYIICNNSVSDMKIEWDDRRFSVTDLTDIKLEDAWEQSQIDEFIELLKSDDEDGMELMRNFGYWLMYRTPTVMTSPFHCYRGQHFYKLCYSSLPEWSKMIIDEVTSGTEKEIYEDSDLKILFRERTNNNNLQKFPHMTKVDDFLKNYKHMGTHYLGDIEKDVGKYYLHVNTYFVKKTIETNSKFISVNEVIDTNEESDLL